MNSLHRILRKVLPFWYQRNWYNGQFEFIPERALVTAAALVIVVILIAFVIWAGAPVEFDQ